jgi:hypothetical protein
MDRDNRQNEDPISSEDMEREKWDDRGTILDEEDGQGHTLPESERDRATADQKPRSGGIGTILPPD